MAFRLSAIDRLPEPPNVHAFRGTVVHRALQLLMWEQAQGERALPVAFTKLERALDELLAGTEGRALALSGGALDTFVEETHELVRNYFVLEDPNSVRVIGTELRLEIDVVTGADQARLPGPDSGAGVHEREAPSHDEGARSPGAGHVRLRGIIDRLELGPDGELTVTDYKTGRAPGQSQELSRLGGLHFYALLCEQFLGKRPATVQLLYVREPLAICCTPSDQSIAGLGRQAAAIWAAIERACLLEDFRPKPGPLCEWCGFHAYCPAMGGDLPLAHPAPEHGDAAGPGETATGLVDLPLATAR